MSDKRRKENKIVTDCKKIEIKNFQECLFIYLKKKKVENSYYGNRMYL